uniref:Uncharacterized protein n=1 Tax=Salix viminalis TaxID=40686 RepID=A0A6N2KLY1_SALVM
MSTLPFNSLPLPLNINRANGQRLFSLKLVISYPPPSTILRQGGKERDAFFFLFKYLVFNQNGGGFKWEN